MEEFSIQEEYIELIKLLKATGFAANGSDAKKMVDDGKVKVNDNVESRKRAKLRKGDKVSFDGNEIVIC